MTVSVIQEQMRQNVFHHTLTVPLSHRPLVSQMIVILLVNNSNH